MPLLPLILSQLDLELPYYSKGPLVALLLTMALNLLKLPLRAGIGS